MKIRPVGADITNKAEQRYVRHN